MGGQEQDRKQAMNFFAHVLHTMLLEDQTPSQSVSDSSLADAAAEWVDRPGLWNETRRTSSGAGA